MTDDPTYRYQLSIIDFPGPDWLNLLWKFMVSATITMMYVLFAITPFITDHNALPWYGLMLLTLVSVFGLIWLGSYVEERDPMASTAIVGILILMFALPVFIFIMLISFAVSRGFLMIRNIVGRGKGVISND